MRRECGLDWLGDRKRRRLANENRRAPLYVAANRIGCQFRPKLIVIRRSALGVQQTNLRRGDLVEQSLRKGRVFASLQTAQMGHPLIGRMLDHVRIVFEQLDAEQPIMIRRQILGRDAQPFSIRIEVARIRLHSRIPSAERFF